MSDIKEGLVVLLVVLVAVSVPTAGCSIYHFREFKHREAMAEMGYVERAEMLPGRNHPIYVWVRAEDE